MFWWNLYQPMSRSNESEEPVRLDEPVRSKAPVRSKEPVRLEELVRSEELVRLEEPVRSEERVLFAPAQTEREIEPVSRAEPGRAP